MRGAIFLALVGCAADARPVEAVDGGPSCAARAGNYDVRFDRRDGTCVPELLFASVDDVARLVPRDCRGTATELPCETRIDMACPPHLDAGSAETVRLTGSVRWSADAFEGHGTYVMQGIAADTTIACTATLAVTYRRR